MIKYTNNNNKKIIMEEEGDNCIYIYCIWGYIWTEKPLKKEKKNVFFKNKENYDKRVARVIPHCLTFNAKKAMHGLIIYYALGYW